MQLDLVCVTDDRWSSAIGLLTLIISRDFYLFLLENKRRRSRTNSTCRSS